MQQIWRKSQTLILVMTILGYFCPIFVNGAVLAVLLSDGTMNARKANSKIEVISTYFNLTLEDCVGKQKIASTAGDRTEAINFSLNDDDGFGTCTILMKTNPNRQNDIRRQYPTSSSSTTARTQDPMDITPTSTSMPLMIRKDNKDPCESNPCKNGGRCTANGQTFKCQCQYPTGGRTCQDLACNNCYRKDDVVVFLNASLPPSMTWKQSKEYCERRGLRLLLDKDRIKHQFVQELLAKAIPAGKTKVAFWIGLERISRTTPFKYTDGTWLDEDRHAPWMAGKPVNNLCVAMTDELVSGTFDWSTEDCIDAKHDGWHFSPLCEQNYPFMSPNDVDTGSAPVENNSSVPANAVDTDADPVLCQPNPCAHTGACKTVKGGKDFVCNCPYPMGGKTCEDLICEQCYRQDDLVIYLNTTTATPTFKEGYDYCKDRGMTLLLDKDRTKHEFVKSVLRKLYPAPETKVAFWIGLKRPANSTEFRYVDGTSLDPSHAPWAPGRPQTNRCAVICTGDYFKYDWDDDDCVKTYLYPGWTYYPLCEKYYPFLSPFFGPVET